MSPLHTPLVLALAAAFPALAARPAPVQGGVERRAPAEPADLDAAELYPPVRNAALLTFFSIEGKLDPEPLRKALAALGTKEVEARIVYGPESTNARPGRFFLAVEAPAGVKPKELVAALKKGASVVEQEVATCFKGPVRDLPDSGAGRMAGMTARDWVLGISNDLRWADTSAGWYQFFSTPGKLDAATIADRFEKLFAPFGMRTVGTLVREGFTWNLAAPCEAATAKKLEKAMQKLPGVRLARVDADNRTLTVQFDLESLLVSGPAVPDRMLAGAAGRPPAEDATPPTRGARTPRVRFDVNPILDLLEKEGVAVARPVAPAAPEPEAPPRGG
ncbi:MAG: cation transporter [Planctomycetes bacterium]|nr:cation transporter [Planctomycetota bacterium]